MAHIWFYGGLYRDSGEASGFLIWLGVGLQDSGVVPFWGQGFGLGVLD